VGVVPSYLGTQSHAFYKYNLNNLTGNYLENNFRGGGRTNLGKLFKQIIDSNHGLSRVAAAFNKHEKRVMI